MANHHYMTISSGWGNNKLGLASNRDFLRWLLRPVTTRTRAVSSSVLMFLRAKGARLVVLAPTISQRSRLLHLDNRVRWQRKTQRNQRRPKTTAEAALTTSVSRGSWSLVAGLRQTQIKTTIEWTCWSHWRGHRWLALEMLQACWKKKIHNQHNLKKSLTTILRVTKEQLLKLPSTMQPELRVKFLELDQDPLSMMMLQLLNSPNYSSAYQKLLIKCSSNSKPTAPEKSWESFRAAWWQNSEIWEIKRKFKTKINHQIIQPQI